MPSRPAPPRAHPALGLLPGLCALLAALVFASALAGRALPRSTVDAIASASEFTADTELVARPFAVPAVVRQAEPAAKLPQARTPQQPSLALHRLGAPNETTASQEGPCHARSIPAPAHAPRVTCGYLSAPPTAPPEFRS